MSLTLTPPTATRAEDETFTIHGLSWDQYVAINDALGDQANLRTLFLDGRLTFVSSAYIHEWSEDALDSIVKAVAIGCEIEFKVVGSTTLRKPGNVADLEGDRAYYFRDIATSMSRLQPIDLQVDPPPDLAIEVENSRKATEAMAIYAQLGVPEVWRHDVRHGTLTFWALRPDRTYQALPHSVGLPFLTPDDVLGQVKLAEEIRSRTRWFVQLTAWVRDVIRPRIHDQP